MHANLGSWLLAVLFCVQSLRLQLLASQWSSCSYSSLCTIPLWTLISSGQDCLCVSAQDYLYMLISCKLLCISFSKVLNLINVRNLCSLPFILQCKNKAASSHRDRIVNVFELTDIGCIDREITCINHNSRFRTMIST